MTPASVQGVKHSWVKVPVAGTATKHACCKHCFAERTIEQRPRIRRYRAKDQAGWRAQQPECKA